MPISRLEEMGTRCATVLPASLTRQNTSKNNGGSKGHLTTAPSTLIKATYGDVTAHGSAERWSITALSILGAVGTTQTGMVGMQLSQDAKSDAVIENNGTINIYASNSYAFSQLGSNGRYRRQQQHGLH